MTRLFNYPLVIITFLLVIGCAPEVKKESYDLLIQGGSIVDGTGSASYAADLLIRGDSIAYIGSIDPSEINVKQVIDANNKIITPGFIDTHAHGDPLDTTSFENFVAMGVTTVLVGQDGYSPDKIFDDLNGTGRWLDSLENKGVDLNISLLAGHGTIRRKAGISDGSVASEEQLVKISQLMSLAMEAGCYGMSTGLEYVPGISANENELVELAKTIGSYDGLIMSHMRSEDDDAIEASISELLVQGAYCRVHVSHLKVVLGHGAKRGQQILTILEEAKKNGIEVSADVYPYMAGYTGIGILFPKWSKTQKDFEMALEERPTELANFLKNKVTLRNGPEAVLFGSTPYAGKTLAEAAKSANLSYLDFLLKMGPEGGSGAFFVMDQELQEQFILDPAVAISTDGSPTMRHPRGYGTYSKIIQQYVVSEGKMPIEIAIHKMTGLPSKILALNDRGTVKVGQKADLVVFNPKDVKDQADFVNPFLLAQGFTHVLINGIVVRSDEQMTERSAGKVLRKR